ncbi:MAG TPA: toprim domain-containing protein [Cyclobacteriaceae bacterium]|jgi:hypothetical protein|nr:toprim domain-containing protein [Cyclobacteriaceae bacterium]
MTFTEAKSIPIPEFLSRLGFEPSKKQGVNYWYYSPFRKEREPSFKVDVKMNVWFDHGSGEGGTILDLGSKLHSCSLHEFMMKLSAGNYSFDPERFQKSLPVEPPEYVLKVIAVKDLTSLDLLFYLQERGIEKPTAAKYCKEVDFSIRDKTYRAIGFINRSGGYELRNPWLKRSSSPKDISIINTSSDISFIENSLTKICLLEGFIDFLSLVQTAHKELTELKADSSFMILNSLSFLNRNIELIRSYKEINVFLDNDPAGEKAKAFLKSEGISFYDASIFYKHSKDLNEYHIKNTPSVLGKAKGQSR